MLREVQIQAAESLHKTKGIVYSKMNIHVIPKPLLTVTYNTIHNNNLELQNGQKELYKNPYNYTFQVF